MKIPKKLSRNPIIDATAEVRFESGVPEEAVFGLIYSVVSKTFGEPERLPVLDIPAAIREANPILRFAAGYKFRADQRTLQVGPHVFALSTSEYVDWESTKPVFEGLIDQLVEAKVFGTVVRIGLRYVNFFKDLNVFEQSTVHLSVADVPITQQDTSFRTQEMRDEFSIVIQMTNHAETELNGGEGKLKGSVLDIDVSRNDLHISPSGLSAHLLELYSSANALADEAFFKLLKPSFIESFGPEYE